MSASTSKAHREFLPSTNQALAELEQQSGHPVLLVDDPDLVFLASISRAGPGQSSHILRLKGEKTEEVDYLITSQCRMVLRGIAAADGSAQVAEKRHIREKVISEFEKLHKSLPLAKAREIGKFTYNGLIVQLRSMGPGMPVDLWIQEHCPDLREAQARSIEAQINNNLGILDGGSRAGFPPQIFKASVSMNAAYAVFGGDLLGKPYLSVPYVSHGYGDIARKLIRIALGETSDPLGITDREIIDAWAGELGISGWYDWIQAE